MAVKIKCKDELAVNRVYNPSAGLGEHWSRDELAVNRVYIPSTGAGGVGNLRAACVTRRVLEQNGLHREKSLKQNITK